MLDALKKSEGEQSPSAFNPVKFISGLNIAEDAVLENIRVNCKRILPRLMVKKAVVCGGGPSLADHLADIRRKKAQGFHIFALNNAGEFLKKHGIQPNVMFMIDARPQNVDFVSEPDEKITYFIGSMCDPDVFDALDGMTVHMVHCAAVEGAVDLIAKENPGTSILGSASTVGLQALNLLDVLGYRIAHLYGYDSSHRGLEHHAYAQELNNDQVIHDFKFNGTVYYSSGPMASQAEQFIQVYRKYVMRGMDLHVFGDGLLPAMWRFHEAARTGGLELSESVKYTKIWRIKQYRTKSFGDELVQCAISQFDLKPPSSVIDFGCGTGRATAKFKALGYDVLGIDFAPNCLDEGIDIPFRVANLWQLPSDVRADFGYCCDVMEHIPPDKVDAVLASIRKATEVAFFNISFREDQFGALIGETLHLSVHQPEWWLEKLKEHWGHVEYLDGSFICKEQGSK